MTTKPLDPRPPVDFSQLRAFLFCRRVEMRDSGVTLIDVHDTRLATTFPAKFDDLMVYLSFESVRSGPLRCRTMRRGPDGATAPFTDSELEADRSSRVALSPIDFGEVEFPVPGKYSFALYVEDVLVGATSFTIVDMSHAATA